MPSDEMLYQVVAARRAQWDNLLWQVPVLSLTAQAFLFTISLAPDTSRIARGIAALLSIVMSILSITLMARHRQAELTDAHWLEDYEKQFFPNRETIHGEQWQARRDAVNMGPGLIGCVPLVPGYKTWIIGLSAFLFAGLTVLVVTFSRPAILSA